MNTRTLKSQHLVMITGVVLSIILPITLNAQLPPYLPPDSVVAYWPFDGNTSDGSGNGNHLTTAGPVVVPDGVGYASSSYQFDGEDDWMTLGKPLIVGRAPATFSLWAKTSYTGISGMVFLGQTCDTLCGYDFQLGLKDGLSYYGVAHKATVPGDVNDGAWHHYVVVMGKYDDYSYQNVRFFIDGLLVDSLAGQQNWGGWQYNLLAEPFVVGKSPWRKANVETTMNGLIDDLCVWSRALRDEEVESIYRQTLRAQCTPLIDSNPANVTSASGQSATFSTTATSTAGSVEHQWQSQVPGLNWVSLEENATYVGVQTPSLTVANVHARNHQQQFRVLATNEFFCVDTSEVAVLVVNDTCTTTVYDTVRIGVTDTLYITLAPSSTGSSDSAYVKVYPNPTASHIVIETEQNANLADWVLVITDVTGKTVHRSAVTDNVQLVSLKELSGTGQYFLVLQDEKGQIRATKVVVVR